MRRCSGRGRRSLAKSAPVKGLLERVRHPYATALIAELLRLQQTTLDRAFLASFGRFWKEQKDLDTLIEPAPWRDGLDTAQAASLEAPARPCWCRATPGSARARSCAC